MPVTSFGPSSAAGPGHGSSAAQPIAAMPANGAVGHGVTRLMARAPAFGVNVKFVPGSPTAEAGDRRSPRSP